MDAVRYKIYFGGTYREQWTADYHMSVVYSDRRCVEAEFNGEGWTPCGGDEELCALLLSKDCPELTKLYFQAAAEAYSAAQDCLRRGLTLDRLGECARFSDNPLTAPELMRLLMDDCGFSLNMAFHVCAHCCPELHAMGVDAAQIYELQPRTAHVISILRNAASELLAAAHDTRKSEYRFPYGAVCCGETVTLTVKILSGRVLRSRLILWSDDETEELPMERSGDRFTVSFAAPERAQAMWYCFRLETEQGVHWLSPDETEFIGRLSGSGGSGFRLTVYERGFETPEWFRQSVMYQIFPDRFALSEDDTAERGIAYHRSLGQTPELHGSTDEEVRWQPREFERAYSPDDFYGGTLMGIEDRLPYLKELGISCIYLNPIVEARSNHRYDTSDYSRPDPVLGTMEDFERLCRRAGEYGIHIILDGVFSHTGADSRYFDRYGHYGGGACSGEASEYYPWYDFRSFPEDYRCWWGFKDLPEVDEKNEKWQRDVVTGKNSVVKSWLRHGASGWRLDVADELPDDVLEKIRTAVKEEAPDAPIIGEVWEDAVIKESMGGRRRYALGTALDSVMNYPFRLAVLDFIHGRTSAYQLRDFLIAQQMNYPKPMYYSLMNLLGSHDVDRLRSALATDVVIRSLSREEQLTLEFTPEALHRALKLEKLCAAIQFSIPGVPSIYYGDEQGMCGVCDPFNRRFFKEGERELYDYYRVLAEKRNSSDALRTGKALFMAENSHVLMILRYIEDGKDAFGNPSENGVFLAVINRGSTDASYSADCTAEGLGVYRGVTAAETAEIIKIM